MDTLGCFVILPITIVDNKFKHGGSIPLLAALVACQMHHSEVPAGWTQLHGSDKILRGAAYAREAGCPGLLNLSSSLIS